MALEDDVTARLPAQVILEATNPRDATATSNNATKLTNAVADIQEWFETYAQQEYDSTVTMHQMICVQGVRDLLNEYGSGDRVGSAEFWEKFRAKCVDFSERSIARGRIEPTGSSQTVHSTSDATTIRPEFDDEQFSDRAPFEPRGPRQKQD